MPVCHLFSFMLLFDKNGDTNCTIINENMAQKQNKNDYIETENNLDIKSMNSSQLMQQSSDYIINDLNNDNIEINPRIKRQKTNNDKTVIQSRINKTKRSLQSTKQCNICHQSMDDVKVYQNNFCHAVFEDVALTDEKLHLSIDGDTIDDNLNLTYKLINFSVYDDKQHLCRFDTGLIEANIHLYCSGYIIPIYNDNSSEECGVAAKNIGPINEWYTTGFDGGEKVLVCISTQFAEYYLIKPSEQYKSLMDPVYEKAYMSKLVIEFITTKYDPTYEDLIDELQMVEPPEGMPRFTEESLLNNVQFICDQITSLDINSDNSDDFPLLTTSCMRSLVNLTGVTVGKTLKLLKENVKKSPVKKRKKSWTTPAMTNVVQEIFEKFYPKNHDIKSKKSKFTKACGACGVCRKPDCGSCYACKKSRKLKKSKGNREICMKRKCPNQAIKDADINYETDEDNIAGLSQKIIDIPKTRQVKLTRKNVTWLDESAIEKNKRLYYNCAQVGSNLIIPGDYIVVDVVNPPSEQIARVVNMWEEIDGGKKIHINWYLRGKDTILGNIADEHELFAAYECTDISINCIKRQCTVNYLAFPQDWDKLNDAIDINDKIQPKNSNKKTDIYYYRKRYMRDFARFEDLTIDIDKINNNSQCSVCIYLANIHQELQPHADKHDVEFINNRMHYNIVNYRNNKYRVGSGIYILPSTVFIKKKLNIPMTIKAYPHDIDENLYPEYYRKYFTGDHVKGSNYDTPEPFDIGYVRDIYTKTNSKYNELNELWVKFNRMYRCEDTHESSSSLIHKSDINLLYWSDEIYEIPFTKIMGKCNIIYIKSLEFLNNHCMMPHEFYFTKMYDAKEKTFSDLPINIIETIDIYRENGNEIKTHNVNVKPLKTLDIFAGCGGLSAGLIKAGVADVRWAIERDRAAARAFQANHSQTLMYQGDCNSLLEDIMSNRQEKGFPQKGDVELLCGGPPCQGFSGLNRFNSTQYSYLKNTLLFTFLSYCDYYKPRYIIMENVLNFTLHNKGIMLKIAMYCFLKIGYQCTVAILQAGNFGLPQSRRRTILLAAAPGETLPMYPDPLYVFSKRACQLDVMIDGKKYSSNCFWKDSAPYRTINVRDAISDLPHIENHDNTQRQIVYGSEAISHFQRKMRNSADHNQYVMDHICKKMSPLVLARIENIPKTPGADWRDLPNIVVRLNDGTLTNKLIYRYIDEKGEKNNLKKLRGVCSCVIGQLCNPLDRQENTLIPWCLPHTANRQYGWAGTYGRLDWDGFFGTTITNPEPLGKQGRVLHPEQSRVVSVRECARSQGFPDNYRFEGTLIEKYRQIGNAVPPPLAEAIGYEIKRVVEKINNIML